MKTKNYFALHIAPHIELGVIEQRQLNLLAENGNIGLRKRLFGSTLPLGAVFPTLRQCEHIGPGIQDGAQRAAVFGGEGAV